MPKDEDVVIEDIVVGANGIMKRIPQEIRSTFTYQQSAAIEKAFSRTRHDVDIRISLPLPGRRRYLVVLMGKERRSDERRRLERLRQPLLTAMNIVTMTIFGALTFFFAVGLVQILFS